MLNRKWTSHARAMAMVLTALGAFAWAGCGPAANGGDYYCDGTGCYQCDAYSCRSVSGPPGTPSAPLGCNRSADCGEGYSCIGQTCVPCDGGTSVATTDGGASSTDAASSTGDSSAPPGDSGSARAVRQRERSLRLHEQRGVRGESGLRRRLLHGLVERLPVHEPVRPGRRLRRQPVRPGLRLVRRVRVGIDLPEGGMRAYAGRSALHDQRPVLGVHAGLRRRGVHRLVLERRNVPHGRLLQPGGVRGRHAPEAGLHPAERLQGGTAPGVPRWLLRLHLRDEHAVRRHRRPHRRVQHDPRRRWDGRILREPDAGGAAVHLEERVPLERRLHQQCVRVARTALRRARRRPRTLRRTTRPER